MNALTVHFYTFNHRLTSQRGSNRWLSVSMLESHVYFFTVVFLIDFTLLLFIWYHTGIKAASLLVDDI